MTAADLHLHTFFSDGTWSPEEVVSRATAAGLTALAITDHDTLEACPRAAAACQAAGLDFLPAVELTAELAGVEMHLLGYGLDAAHPELQTATARFQEVRQGRIQEMVSRLNALGIPLQAEAVFALANCRSPGRPHVARALVAAGHCRSVDDAFERFLKRDRPAWVPKFKIEAPEAIRLVHRAGGLAVLAHPGLNRVDPMIPTLVDAGLDGIECFHTKHTASTSEHYLGLARTLKLLVTGGSDCHGMAKGKPLIGTVRLAAEFYERLRAAIGRGPRRAETSG